MQELPYENQNEIRGHWKSIAPDMCVKPGLSRQRYIIKNNKIVLIEIFVQRDAQDDKGNILYTEYGARWWRDKQNRWSWPDWIIYETYHSKSEALKAIKNGNKNR